MNSLKTVNVYDYDRDHVHVNDHIFRQRFAAGGRPT
jgi:hypothetical protein